MYSRTALYGHPPNTDTSLLRTVFFVYRERKPSHAFSLNSTHLFRTPLMSGTDTFFLLNQPILI